MRAAPVAIGAWEAPLAHEIFGTDDPGDVADALASVWPFEECFAVNASAGLTFGLRDAAGRRVALKAYRPSFRPSDLAGVRAVQQELFDGGFPCPRPLFGPVPLGRSLAAVDEWRDEGELRDLHEPALRARWAAALARLVRLAERHVGRTTLPRLSSDLWERPHNPRFDLVRPDGRWIDDAAGSVRDAVFGPVEDWAVGHCDWSAQQVRWLGGEVAVVYDWDSLVRDSEANIAGFASAAFTATWELPIPKAPAPAEGDLFLAEYEQARGAPFSPEQRRRAAAARVYVTAYAARCELSDLGGEGDFQRALRQLL